MSFKNYYPDSRSNGLQATLKSKFAANPLIDDIGIIKILSDDTAQLDFPTTGKSSKIMSFDMFTLLRPRSDEPPSDELRPDENAHPNTSTKRSRLPASPAKGKPDTSQGGSPVKKKPSKEKSSKTGKGTPLTLSAPTSVSSFSGAGNEEDKLQTSSSLARAETALDTTATKPKSKRKSASLALRASGQKSDSQTLNVLSGEDNVLNGEDGALKETPLTLSALDATATKPKSKTSAPRKSDSLDLPSSGQTFNSQTPNVLNGAYFTGVEGKRLLTNSTLSGRPPSGMISNSQTPYVLNGANFTGEGNGHQSQESDLTDSSQVEYFQGLAQHGGAMDGYGSDVASIKDGSEVSVSVRSRTMATVVGDFLVNPGSKTFPNLSLLLTYTNIVRDKERKLDQFPHSAGLKNRHFPGHKAVTGYYLGCIEYSGAPVTIVQIDEHIDLIFKMLYFVASRVSYFLASSQIYRHFLALFAGSNTAIGSAESVTAQTCPVAGMLNRKLFDYLTADDKVHECFRIPFANKLMSAISHRLESVRTMCTSLDGVTLVGFRCIDEESIAILATFLRQWIELRRDDDGYVSFSDDTLPAVPDKDPKPDVKRPLFILEKILQLAHFTIPELPPSSTKDKKDLFMMSYSVHDMVLVAVLLYESLCQGKAHVVPNSKRLSGIASLIEEKRLSNRSSIDTTREIYNRKIKDAVSDYGKLVTFSRGEDLASWRAVTFTAWTTPNARASRRFRLSEGEMNEAVGTFDSLYD